MSQEENPSKTENIEYSEQDVNDALNNALNSNTEMENSNNVPIKDDGDEYQPEIEVDAEAEAEEEVEDEDYEDEDTDLANKEHELDGSKKKLNKKKKLPINQRRPKQSNLNAVNKKRQQSTPTVFDEMDDENNLPVENDEIITPDDIKGDKKITLLGELKGGRKFRVKTFKVPNRGDRLYAISTDVARLVGYRDSYFLFQKHENLYRVRIDEDSKMSLINDGYLPGTFKTRAAYLVTARSSFKEFGARIIEDGRQIIDDYYEDKARDEGAIEGAIINPILSTDGYTNTTTNNQTLFERQRNIALLLSNNNILETQTSWVYDHALKCRQFDSMLFYDRNELLKKKVQRDIYTNLNFVPNITQPNRSKITKLKSNSNSNETKRKIIFDTVIGGNNIVSTGLADVPLEIFDGTVSDDIKRAILQQQLLERQL